MTPWFTEQEQHIWAPFVVSVLHLLAQLNNELEAAFDITHLDYGVLILLKHSPDRNYRMSELTRTFGVIPSVMTYRIRRLEDRGYVQRTASPDDGRVIYVRLTASGLELVTRAQIFHVAGVRRHFLQYVEPHQEDSIKELFHKLQQMQQSAEPLLNNE